MSTNHHKHPRLKPNKWKFLVSPRSDYEVYKLNLMMCHSSDIPPRRTTSTRQHPSGGLKYEIRWPSRLRILFEFTRSDFDTTNASAARVNLESDGCLVTGINVGFTTYDYWLNTKLPSTDTWSPLPAHSNICEISTYLRGTLQLRVNSDLPVVVYEVLVKAKHGVCKTMGFP